MVEGLQFQGCYNREAKAGRSGAPPDLLVHTQSVVDCDLRDKRVSLQWLVSEQCTRNLLLLVISRSSLTDCGVMTDGDMGSSHAYSLCPDCGSAVNCTCTNTSFGVVSETDADMILHLGDFAYNFDTAVGGQ